MTKPDQQSKITNHQSTILIIEDNTTNLYLMKFLLEKNGYVVITAKSGMQGVDLSLKEKPDLILMDIQLPDIDGLEATRRIRIAEGGLRNEPQSAIRNPQSAIRTPQSAIRNPQSRWCPYWR